MSFCCHDFVPRGELTSDAGTEEEDQPSSSKARAGRGAISPLFFLLDGMKWCQEKLWTWKCLAVVWKTDEQHESYEERLEILWTILA